MTMVNARNSALTEHPLYIDATRTAFSDAVYAALGRGLALATRYEANCRVLAEFIGLKEALKTRDPASDESLDDLFHRLAQEYWEKRRLRHHESALVLHEKLPDDIRAILRKGRAARNLIAHELALGTDQELQTDAGCDALLAALREAVTAIAEADRLVCFLEALKTDTEAMLAPAFDRYVEDMVEWVCDVEG
jgi:hypothetical protein